MILLAGIESEPPLALVADRLSHHGAHHLVFDQRNWSTASISGTVERGQVTGSLGYGGEQVPLESITAAYSRLMDDRRLPDVVHEPDGSPRRAQCRALHAAFAEWLEVGPRVMLNRARAQSSNASKPYQAQRIREHGLSIPETLITNDPELAEGFVAQHERVIYKSASGVRSIVKEFAPDDRQRLDQIRWCPVQFQERVPGVDVRVHVVGRETFATQVDSDGVDYRYAARDGGVTELSIAELPDNVLAACVDLAEALELPLAGVDLRITPEGRVVCFEVNPSPGFSYYENQTGQPIADAIARHLMAADGR